MDERTKKQLDVIGRNLRRYRTAAKLTQKQVAERAGISVSHYANLERGNKAMSAWTLRSLADALNVSADLLLYGETRDLHVQNIRHLLRDKPDGTLTAAENLIRALLEDFTAEDESEATKK